MLECQKKKTKKVYKVIYLWANQILLRIEMEPPVIVGADVSGGNWNANFLFSKNILNSIWIAKQKEEEFDGTRQS